MLTGKHLIAGDWVDGPATFQSSPSSGEPKTFAVGSPDLVARACEAAEDAFPAYSATTREARAVFLEKIAEELDARGDEITEVGCAETGLPEARLIGERGRTAGQLRLFADHIRKGAYLDRRHDAALPDRQPLPRPDLKMIQVPTGPVGVFGASNFPLAFSTVGGDTASALAAGCPVVVKGHSAHPGTGELAAQAVAAAVEACGMPAGTFSLIQGGNRAVGEALVTHPLIRAIGFTGSLAGGRALFDLCASRPDPIPFFGELGSVNPMFIMPAALAARGAAIAQGWAGSLTMGAGQFCTNHGIAVVPKGTEGDAFAEAAKAALGGIGAQTMLTDGIAKAYREGRDRVAGSAGVREVLTSVCDLRNATPYLYEVSAEDWLANEELGEEVFGPLGVMVRTTGLEQMVAIARTMQGQLTATVHVDDDDHADASVLMPLLVRKAGRVLANGYPTGVEVADSMVHGGPYPASTNFGATSVGTLAIRRWLRPVCFQNMPDALLPEDLR
jgi:NADP-dependent aldehyde dehydrogenase